MCQWVSQWVSLWVSESSCESVSVSVKFQAASQSFSQWVNFCVSEITCQQMYVCGVERLGYLVLRIYCFPSYCLLTPLMSPKEKICNWLMLCRCYIWAAQRALQQSASQARRCWQTWRRGMPSMPPLLAPMMTGKLLCGLLPLLSFRLFV